MNITSEDLWLPMSVSKESERRPGGPRPDSVRAPALAAVSTWGKPGVLTGNPRRWWGVNIDCGTPRALGIAAVFTEMVSNCHTGL